MRQSERDKRTYLIIGLCAVLVVMVVGFAAFSSQLQINGTSNISSNWDVQITGITRFASSGSGVSDVSGSPTYDNSNGLTATFNTNLTSPGDYAIYKIKIENLGSLNAKLSKITLNANASDDITYYVNKNQNNSSITDTDRLIGENDVLKPTGDSSNLDEGYVYVTVKYNNYNGQSSPTGGNKTVTATVKLDFVQSNSEATPTPTTFTGTIYRNNDTQASIGDSIATESGTKWIVKFNGEEDESVNSDVSNDNNNKYYFDSPSECSSFLADSWDVTEGVEDEFGDTFTCSDKTITFGGVGNYTTSQSEIQSGYSAYLKHTVVDDIITESYVCTKFAFRDEAVCLRGGDESYSTPNRGILGGLESTFNSNGGECISGDGYLTCQVYISDFHYFGISNEDHEKVVSYNQDVDNNCKIYLSGNSYCENETYWPPEE